MDNNTNEISNNKVRPIARLIVAAFCLFLMLISFALVNINTHIADAHPVTKNTSLILPPTDTPTDTPTPTPTDTPTPTPTDTPTPTPTKTPNPTPTPKPTPKPTTPPTATPTTALGVTPTATTIKPTTTAQPATPTSSGSNQTPTPISGAPTTTTNNSNNGGNNNSPTTPTGGGFSIPFGSITVGLLGFLGLASALFIGFAVFRRYLLPSPTPQASLPPSGAQPWRRVRTGSLSGIADVQSVQNDWDNWLSKAGYAGAISENRSLPQSGTSTMDPNNGYNITNNNSSPSAVTYPGSAIPIIPPYSQGPITSSTAYSSPNNVVPPNNNNAFSPVPLPPNTGVSPNSAIYNYPGNNIYQSTSSSVLPAPNIAKPQFRPLTPPINNDRFAQPHIDEQQYFSSGVVPPQRTQTASDPHPQSGAANAEPVNEHVRPPARQITRPIRLKNIQNAASPQSMPDPMQQNRLSERHSEELPSLNNPVLRDTLGQYFQQGESDRPNYPQ